MKLLEKSVDEEFKESINGTIHHLKLINEITKKEYIITSIDIEKNDVLIKSINELCLDKNWQFEFAINFYNGRYGIVKIPALENKRYLECRCGDDVLLSEILVIHKPTYEEYLEQNKIYDPSFNLNMNKQSSYLSNEEFTKAVNDGKMNTYRILYTLEPFQKVNSSKKYIKKKL